MQEVHKWKQPRLEQKGPKAPHLDVKLRVGEE